MIEVEVIYALADVQQARRLDLQNGSTVATALAAAGLIDAMTSDERRSLKFGIFGRIVEPDQPLDDGDRIEIYRPLLDDPKLARQRRVAAGRRRKQGVARL